MITVDFLRRPLVAAQRPQPFLAWLATAMVLGAAAVSGVQYYHLRQVQQQVAAARSQEADWSRTVAARKQPATELAAGPRRWSALLAALPELGPPGTRWGRITAEDTAMQVQVRVPSLADLTQLVERLLGLVDVAGVEVQRIEAPTAVGEAVILTATLVVQLAPQGVTGR